MSAFDRLDAFWERLKLRYPVLHKIDRADWHTWIQHAFVVLTWGLALSWATPLPLSWSWRFFVALYLWREIRNVRDRRRLRWPIKPLDHVMDVLVPLVVVEVLNALLA
jgi:hypothetical protein